MLKTLKTTSIVFGISLLMLAAMFELSSLKPPEKLLNRALEWQVFYGHHVAKERYIIIVDYSKTIFHKRLWVYDLEEEKIILAARVSHAIKSGLIRPHDFSNEVGSNLSCVGSFVTQEIYESQFGKGEYKVGMRITGLENRRNDNVRERFIVFHSGIPVYSQGCFITWPHINKRIGELCSDGSFMFATVKAY